MALEAKNINTISDMQTYVEGCVNDFELGLSTKAEFMKYMFEYTNRLIEIGINIGEKKHLLTEQNDFISNDCDLIC